MLKFTRRSYKLEINSVTGTVDRLTLPSQAGGPSLVHHGDKTGFGAIVITRRDEESLFLRFSDNAMAGDTWHLREHRLFTPVSSHSGDRIECRNAVMGHSLSYHLADDYFDLTVEGDLPYANQVGLDLDVAFMDLRQDDPPESQFMTKCPYRSEDRSLCYVYLARPRKPDMLITALTPAAGWRLRYARPWTVGRGPEYAVQGLQMLARFDDGLDQQAKPGPVRFAVRVSFPRDVEEARRAIAGWLGMPVFTATHAAGAVGTRVPFTVFGPVAGIELKTPSGDRRTLELQTAGPECGCGEVKLDVEGFHVLRAWNSDGRGSDMILHARASELETLRRATANLRPGSSMSYAERQYFLQAFCMARDIFGPDARHDAWLHEALVTIGMQGLPFQGEPRRAERNRPVFAGQAIKDGLYVGVPAPRAHDFRGKRFGPFHLYEWERVEDAFEFVRTYLYAARTFGNDLFYEHAVRIAEAHIRDNVDDRGCVYNVGHCAEAGEYHDYTTVITPHQALVELTMEMERRKDARASAMRAVCVRIADFLVRRGLEFPTEGISPHLRFTEDGSIACTALSLLYFYWHMEKKPEYLQTAEKVLAFHEPWRMDAPDARMLGSSNRFWETQYENDGEGKAINAGHAWTLWSGEALYYHALITGNARSLLGSYNAYHTNFCKYRPDGTTCSCFTPDFIPDRMVRKELFHCYPRTADRINLAFYLWPRVRETWLRTSAVMGPAAVGAGHLPGPIVLNGAACLERDVVLEVELDGAVRDRLFVLGKPAPVLRLKTTRRTEILFAPAEYKLKVGKKVAGARAEACVVEPESGRIELVAAE